MKHIEREDSEFFETVVTESAKSLIAIMKESKVERRYRIFTTNEGVKYSIEIKKLEQ